MCTFLFCFDFGVNVKLHYNFTRVKFPSLCLLSTFIGLLALSFTHFDVDLNCLVSFCFVFLDVYVSRNGQKTIDAGSCMCTQNALWPNSMYTFSTYTLCVHTKQLNQNGWDIISFIWFAFMSNACFMLNVCFSCTIFGTQHSTNRKRKWQDKT